MVAVEVGQGCRPGLRARRLGSSTSSWSMAISSRLACRVIDGDIASDWASWTGSSGRDSVIRSVRAPANTCSSRWPLLNLVVDKPLVGGPAVWQ